MRSAVSALAMSVAPKKIPTIPTVVIHITIIVIFVMIWHRTTITTVSGITSNREKWNDSTNSREPYLAMPLDAVYLSYYPVEFKHMTNLLSTLDRLRPQPVEITMRSPIQPTAVRPEGFMGIL